MEGLIFGVLCFVGMPAFGFLVWVIVRLNRISALEQRINTLDTELLRLHETYGHLARKYANLAEAPRVVAVETPAPAVSAPVAPVAEEPVVAPAVVAPVEVSAKAVESAPAPAAAETPVPPVPSKPPEQPSAPPINWEKWLGIRGAAAVGGIVFAIALIMLAKYSIEAGLISPELRLVAGALMAIGALVGSEYIRGKYATTANAIAGAGIVGMYAIAYAAKNTYGLIPTEAAFAIMVMATVVCALISVRHDTQFTAMLGLLGGFATPLMLSTGENRPYAFFGYILLLDAGFVTVALKKKWHLLTGASLLGTALMQAGWMVSHMESNQAVLALGILLVFAGLFVGAALRSMPAKQSLEWVVTQGAAIVLPLCIGLYLATRTDIELSPLFFGGMVLVLSIGAVFVSHRSGAFPISLSAAVLSSVVIALRLMVTSQATSPNTWEWVGIMLALPLVFHVGFELKRTQQTSMAALIPVGTMWLALTALQGSRHSEWVPCLVGVAALLVLALRHMARQGEVSIGVLATVGATLTWAIAAKSAGDEAEHLRLLFVGTFAVAALLALALLRRGKSDGRLFAQVAATAAVSTSGLMLSVAHFALGEFATALLVASLCAVTLLESDAWLIGVFSLTLVQSMWMVAQHTTDHRKLVFSAAWLVLFTVWRYLTGPALQRSRWWLWASIASPVLFFLPVYIAGRPWEHAAILPLALSALALGAAVYGRSSFWKEHFAETALAGYGGVALSFVALAIPLELERHWIWVGWSAMGFALIFWWQRVNHAGLKYFGALLLLLSIAGLTFSPPLSFDFRTSARALPIVNWILYTYGIAIIASLAASRILNSLEVVRVGPREKALLGSSLPVFALALYAGALWLGFVYLNVAIADFFSAGGELGYHREASRDVATSVGWGLYALLLLVLGVIQTAKPLRWGSLILLLITLVKVTFYDMGNLTGLYRVFSLLGLAAALIIVSLLYQRFVFQKDKPIPASPPEGTTP